MSEETKQPMTPHEMLLAKGFKGMRPERDINIAAIVADDYAKQEIAPLHVRIAELEAENYKHFTDYQNSLEKIRNDKSLIVEALEAELAAEKQKAERMEFIPLEKPGDDNGEYFIKLLPAEQPVNWKEHFNDIANGRDEPVKEDSNYEDIREIIRAQLVIAQDMKFGKYNTAGLILTELKERFIITRKQSA